MCGILGVVASPGAHPDVTESQLITMRDLMERRGPDGAGLALHGPIAFASRRLAIIDPTGGEQPRWSPDRSGVLVYNGELYNDAEVRAALEAEGVGPFRDRCDTETVCQALAHWGVGALERLRGMYAMGWYDFERRTLLLARDPLGIKPLYYASVGREFVFASHIPSILAHPKMQREPNAAVVSAYLSTIRTTLGAQTLFDGVFTLQAGQYAQITFDGAGSTPGIAINTHWHEPETGEILGDLDSAPGTVRTAAERSIMAHLRSDVPRCMLLSGGLDSAIIASVCRGADAPDVMRTWCAGDEDDSGCDLHFAREVAGEFGTQHREVVLDGDGFCVLWKELMAFSGLPLTTPNETAIAAVAQSIHGHAKVALSGEGADELFGGYAVPYLGALDQSRVASLMESQAEEIPWRARYLREVDAQYGTSVLGSQVDHYLRLNTWIHPSHKHGVLSPEVCQRIDQDAALIGEIGRQFAMDREESLEPLEQVLRVHRRINLTGLLARLDTSTMFASIEGRTPFADRDMAALAARIGGDLKLTDSRAADGGWHSAAQTVRLGTFESKRVLRRAFERAVPEAVTTRPKASFPIPFAQWMMPRVEILGSSAVARDWFNEEILTILHGEAENHWMLAWPVVNIAHWLEQWWG